MFKSVQETHTCLHTHLLSCFQDYQEKESFFIYRKYALYNLPFKQVISLQQTCMASSFIDGKVIKSPLI